MASYAIENISYNVLWSPKDGPTIQLWKKNVVGWAKLF
jgi:hypothetical protein